MYRRKKVYVRASLRSLVLFAMLCCTCFQSFAQQKFTINGFIKDSLTGETLIGASINISGGNRGVATNGYGFFSITLPKAQYEISCSFIGYESKLYRVSLDSNQSFDIFLVPRSFAQTNVIVTGRRRDANVKNAQMGRVDLSIEKIKQIPAFLGEIDILKAIQLLPGVRNAGEGNSGFYVRGGAPDQNLLILDDAVVYNPGHLFGFFSIFNSDAIKNVTLIKGGMPAQYGGRLSSVVDVTMKDGNNQQTQIEGGIGLIASRLSIQGPIKKDKSSYIISGRRTYIDAIAKPLINKGNFAGSGYYFYDLNAKMNFILGSKDRLFFSGYFGRDVFSFKNKERDFNTGITWGNSTAAARWNHVFNRKLFANTTLLYNDYKFQFDAVQDNFKIILSSGIKDLSGKIDFDYYPVPEHKIKFGGLFTYHRFKPNQLSGSQDSTVFNPNTGLNKFANETGLYVQDDWEVSNKIKVNAGLRFGSFTQIGPYNLYTTDVAGNRLDSTVYGRGKKVRGYNGVEPRFTFRYALTDSSSLKFAVTRNVQYIHLATNSGSTLPTDLWVPSTYRVNPQLGWQYAAGYFRNFNDNTWETSVEAYFKTMENQIEYKEGANVQSLRDPEEDFTFGRGWSYGAEFFVNKVKGRFTGWIGYTLSWTYRKFPKLSNGNVFPAKYDRRHDMSIVANYDLSPKWKLGAVFVYGTGNATTYPERFYIIQGNLVQQYGTINSYRLPAYHRLDLAATYTPNKHPERRLKSSWIFSIYNTYSRANPYFIYFDQMGSPYQGTLQVSARQVSLFPVLPTVTWNFKF
ncbi:MAG: TonB-dependent receptor [Chitinophagaceae bacterium]